MKKITLDHLFTMKEKGETIVGITAYDALFARMVSEQGIELILVGDSVGVVALGYETTIPVTIEEMVHHTAACARGHGSAFLMADMPFQSYATPEIALANATKLMQAGAEMVKLEGGAFLAETVEFLTTRGIPVCAHLGLLPQYLQREGGYRFDAKEEEHLLHDAVTLEKAGAQLLILKCVSRKTAQKIAQTLKIPVVGIGAGPEIDGQIQILQDVLGFKDESSTLLSERYLVEGHPVIYMRDFLGGQTEGLQGAIRTYVKAVKTGTFPTAQESFA